MEIHTNEYLWREMQNPQRHIKQRPLLLSFDYSCIWQDVFDFQAIFITHSWLHLTIWGSCLPRRMSAWVSMLCLLMCNYEHYSGYDYLYFHGNQCILFTHLNEHKQTIILIGMHASRITSSHHIPSLKLSQDCHVTLLLSVTSTACSSCKRAEGRKQCVRWETCQCEWCAPVWGVLSSPLCLWPAPIYHPPGQDPLHLLTLLNDLKPQGQKT